MESHSEELRVDPSLPESHSPVPHFAAAVQVHYKQYTNADLSVSYIEKFYRSAKSQYRIENINNRLYVYIYIT